MTDRYVVAGNPVMHSRSPWIHARFAVQTGQRVDYSKLLIEVGDFEVAARKFFDAGGKGMNITLPFKVDACRFADRLSERARLAGAVNTLALQADGLVLGDNTDGVGLLRDLGANLGWQLAGQRILLLGAGGAARGVIGPLLEQSPRQLLVANRTAIKAEQLCASFAGPGSVSGCGYDTLSGTFDLVINSTSASLAEQVPMIPAGAIGATTCCYDMAYAPAPTAFLRWAASAGALHIADGLGMLVEQAAESFWLWRGVRPGTADVIASLRALMGAT